MNTAELAETCAGAVSGGRLGRMLDELAQWGAREDGGVDRQTLTTQDLSARRWIAGLYATRAGYKVAIDAAANIFIRREGNDPALAPVLTGSHLDTQPAGGRLDGAFGVVAGLEVFNALDEAGIRTQRAMEVAAWTNEEGCRFSPGLMGSNAFVDPTQMDGLRSVLDAQGITFGAAVDSACQDFAESARSNGWHGFDAPMKRAIHACIEAHIEQGPELERAALQVGCVNAIQGVRWYEMTFSGRSSHAGTTPLAARDDAMVKAVAAAHAVLGMAALEMQADPSLRITVGRFQALPASINTIAREARFTIDLRHPDDKVLEAMQVRLLQLCAQASHTAVLLCKPPVPFDAALHQLTQEACTRLGLPHMSMLSGAFHDAMPLAAHTPTVMLFAPSRDGLSHNPAEHTPIEDLTACTRALAFCMTRLACPN
jgi:beta-ureidopropionase / N-carbamoyl-L-amino-acid hydrolase